MRLTARSCPTMSAPSLLSNSCARGLLRSGFRGTRFCSDPWVSSTALLHIKEEASRPEADSLVRYSACSLVKQLLFSRLVGLVSSEVAHGAIISLILRGSPRSLLW